MRRNKNIRNFIHTLVLFFIVMIAMTSFNCLYAQEGSMKDMDVPKVEVSFIFHLADKVVDGWLSFLDWLGKAFDPIVSPIFKPISRFLERTYQPWAKICALGMFLGTMLWVCFGMKKEYVNLGRTQESLWTDLRIWTIISMLPHVIVYFYF